jgi:hypothetical protein
MESYDVDRPAAKDQPVYYLTEEQEDSLHRDRSPYSYEPGTILTKFIWIFLRFN